MPILRALALRNFRIWKEAHLELNPRLNLFHGQNAQGKTTLLEAIWCCIAGRSFRTPHIRELIHPNAPSAYVEIPFTKDEIDQSIQAHCLPGERRFIHNATPCATIAELIGLLPGVAITPDDPLIMGPPQVRRLFLDLQLAQSDPLYAHHLARYNRALRHRNHLLRKEQLKTISLWEEEMAEAAAYLSLKRLTATKELNEASSKLHPTLAPEDPPLSLHYSNETQTKEAFQDKWEQMRSRDLHLGNTSYGPHREDLTISLGGQSARAFGSEGQKRTCVTLLRLASWKRLKTRTGYTPLLLIDDLATSLDTSRREHLLSHLNTLGQVFLSSTEPPSTLKLPGEGSSFEIRNGKVC